MTWEERMAERAAERRALADAENRRRAEEFWYPTEPTAADEKHIQDYVAQYRDGHNINANYACACMGPDEGHFLCPCDIRKCALQRIEES